VAGVAASPGAEGPDDEEEIGQDRHHDGDDVERDPAPLVGVVKVIASPRDTRHLRHVRYSVQHRHGSVA